MSACRPLNKLSVVVLLSFGEWPSFVSHGMTPIVMKLRTTVYQEWLYLCNANFVLFLTNLIWLFNSRYAMFLFSKQHEELVGIYASQLARHRCIDLFVHMMELRLNSRWFILMLCTSILLTCFILYIIWSSMFYTKVFFYILLCSIEPAIPFAWF